MTQKKPMSLENLPEYLKSVRETGETGDAPLVDMGQIVTTTTSINWFARIAIVLLIFSVSVVAYDTMSTEQITVVVDVQKDADIPKIIADSGGQILSVNQIGGSSVYEVKVETTKIRRNSFLKWLRKNEDVKKAELESNFK